MSFIDQKTAELNCKIIYYGAGHSGKTTNVQAIYARTSPMAKGNLLSLATPGERTLFFDFLPVTLGQIRGVRTRFHLYSVPGQVFYDATRQIILKGLDGVVFVVDSRRDRIEANLESFDNLRVNLHHLGLELDQVPLVLQYNKRDIANPMPIEELQRFFNMHQLPYFEAKAKIGEGVFETFRQIGKMVLKASM